MLCLLLTDDSLLLLTPTAEKLNPSLPSEPRVREIFLLAYSNYDIHLSNKILTAILLIAGFYFHITLTASSGFSSEV